MLDEEVDEAALHTALPYRCADLPGDIDDIPFALRGNLQAGPVHGYTLYLSLASRFKKQFPMSFLRPEPKKVSSLNALGGSSTMCFRPRRVGIPYIGIAPQKVNKKFSKWGSRGYSPWAASPSGGERGSPS